jgi:hypothetical protein
MLAVYEKVIEFDFLYNLKAVSSTIHVVKLMV